MRLPYLSVCRVAIKKRGAEMDTANIQLDESLATMMFGSPDARELLLRKILFRLATH